MSAKKYTKQGMIDTFGIKASTLSTWLKKDIPHTKNGNRNIYNEKELLEWFSKRGMNKYILKLGESKPIKQAVPKDIQGQDPMAFKTILERLRGIEQLAHDNYLSAGEEAYQKLWMEEHRQAAEQLRKWEKDWAQIQLSMGTVISKEDHDKEIREMCMEIRNALLNLPDKCAPMVAGKDTKICRTIIHREVVDCMRSLSE